MTDYKEQIIKVPRFEESQGFYTTKNRSDLMSKIKGKNTKPELTLRKILWNAGLRYRVNYSKLPGKPDIISKKYKLVIFIDGEFWHGFKWEEKKTKIKANRAFWIPKIERNMQRDQANTKKLEDLGFKVFRFWEHEIKKELGRCVKQILDYISQQELSHLC